jgi:hypothetical protein
MKLLISYLNKIQEAEFIAIPGIGKDLEELVLDGNKIYTSKTLKSNVKKAFEKYFPSLSKKISKLIDSEKLIPAFRTKNIIQYLIKRSKIRRNPLGTTRGEKCYIFVDSFYAKFKIASVDEKYLSTIIIHELVHLAKHRNPNLFLRINYKTIIEFYKEFFRNFLHITENIDNKIVDEILLRQQLMEKKGIINFVKLYSPVFTKLRDISNLTENEYQYRFDIFIEYLDKIYVSFTKIVPPEIFDASRKAYLKIAENRSETIGQEFWSPSEIIAIMSELAPNLPNIQKTLDIL